MKLLLTSAGIKNPSLEAALIDLLGKPINQCSALCIPTSAYSNPNGIFRAWDFFNGTSTCPMVELGWKSMGVLELTALPSIKRERWVPTVLETDCLLVNGGDPLFLHYWMRESGLADLLPEYPGVYCGFSAGAMVAAPRIGEDFVGWRPPTGGDDSTLGLVDFAIFPHVDHPDLPDNTMAGAERWAAKLDTPAYAIDDQTGIKVTDAGMEIISEGNWKQLR
jgi:dipeptidase E